MIFVLDFGSQYTQLIAKRLRSIGFSCEVLSGRTQWKELSARKPAGIILSGSPASVGDGTIDPDAALLECGVPVLGLCFGYQFMARHLGGGLSSATHREYGAAEIEVTADGCKDPLLAGVVARSVAWMSHGDSVTGLPKGATLILSSSGRPAGFAVPEKKLWGLQFHPEVHHSVEGAKILENFARGVCRLQPDWNLKDALAQTEDRLRKELAGVKELVCAVSGGVDSTVLAVLLSKVTQVRAVYVDHGFQRAYDLEDLRKTFEPYPNIHLQVLDARQAFWKELNGVSDPETKRKIIGRLFIDTFQNHVGHEHFTHLAQGTIYSDVIESAANDLAPAAKIKSHHNVGGLPPDMKVKLVEPLRSFFKDEVRQLGRLLGIRAEALERHPFPGPGLSIRCIGALTPERIELLQRCDAIFIEELHKRGLYKKTWQAFVALLPVNAVGVMGDGRSYESVLAIRAVSSLEAMTAEATELPWKDLKEITSRLVNEVKGINRVVYDMTSKPPGTIEWE